MISEKLVIDERTGIVRKLTLFRGRVINDTSYKPHGRHVFVNPNTHLLEEGEIPLTQMERNLLGWVEGKCYRKISDFRSNGNSVLYHPTRKELAEVTRGYRLGDLEKVRDLRPER